MMGEPGHGEQQAVHELDPVRIVLHERGEPPADAEVDAGALVDGVHLVHVVALAARHHLERQLVVVAQEDRPLAGLGYVGRLLHDVHDRVAVLLGDRHVDPRHQGEVERHVALVARAEVLGDVLRPLVRLGEEEPVVVVRVERGAHRLQHGVRLGQVLVVRAVALAQVGDGVEPHPVHAQVEPVAHDA